MIALQIVGAVVILGLGYLLRDHVLRFLNK